MTLFDGLRGRAGFSLAYRGGRTTTMVWMPRGLGVVDRWAMAGGSMWAAGDRGRPGLDPDPAAGRRESQRMSLSLRIYFSVYPCYLSLVSINYWGDTCHVRSFCDWVSGLGGWW